TAAMVRLQALLDGVFTPEQRHLALIMGQLSCLSRLIDELHLLSIADAGQLSLEKVRCCPSDILRERLLWIKPQLDEAGINVVSDMPETSVLNVDPFRLGQVFTILMENALRYAGKGTTLFLSTRSINGNYEIIFQDT
ncbi:two-component sensor histidine kinase, partial [Klebsiella pneumoniae]